MTSSDLLFPLGGGDIYCTVSKFNENYYVAFRKYHIYLGNSRKYPSKVGVSLRIPEYLMFLETTKKITTDIRKPLEGRGALPLGRLWSKELGTEKVVSLEVVENEDDQKIFIIKLDIIESPEKTISLTVDMFNEFLRIKDTIARHIEVV